MFYHKTKSKRQTLKRQHRDADGPLSRVVKFVLLVVVPVRV